MIEGIIRDIRKRCRLAMNGVASAIMREQGLHYKLNFGVSIGKIKEIAARFLPDKDLAEALWKDETRELKILATLLYPIDEFDEDTARRWVREIPNQEIREQLGFNMCQFLPYIYQLGQNCVDDQDEGVRASGYWFVGRHLMTENYKTIIDLDLYPYIWDDIISENISLRNAGKFFLKNAGKTSVDLSNTILEKIGVFKDAEDVLKKEIYHGLAFEFDYFYDRFEC